MASAKLYVTVLTLSTQDNVKTLQQLKSGFKRTVNWNKYPSKKSTEAQNRYSDFLISPSFKGANFQNENGRLEHIEYYLLTVEIKVYNVKIDGRNFFDQPITDDTKTYENIKKLLLIKETILPLVVY